MLTRLAHPSFNGDYVDAPLGGAPEDTLAAGSRNLLSEPQGNKKPFRGLAHLGKGSRVMFSVKDGFAGLSDYVSGTSATVGMTINQNTVTATAGVFVIGDIGKTISVAGAAQNGLTLFATITGYTSATVVTVNYTAVATVVAAASVFGTLVQGSGNGFSYIGSSLWYQGAGQFTINGSDITGALASSTLKILLQRAGSYTASDSGPYSAGLAQQSAPNVTANTVPGTGFTGLLNGVYSFKLAVIRAATGARSRASTTSAVIQVVNGTAYLVFPTMQSGGSHFVVFGTQKGFGGTGLHYQAPLSTSAGKAYQIAETDISRSVSDAVTNGTTTLTSATAAFTSYDVGKKVVLSGGGALTTTIAAYVSPTQVTLAAAPGWTSAGNTSVISAYAGSIDRAIEVEYENSDLLDEVAWTDDYPPPAGTHCGALETVTMVGGCYSDATSDPSSTNPGTCVAISLKNFPESFKPAHLLYLPEQIMTMKARSSDSYMPVACRKSLHFIVYTGAVDGPACSLITIWPNVGIGNPHGMCQVYDNIYACVGKGKLARIGANNEVDTAWANPVLETIKNFEPEDTVLEPHLDRQCVTVSNGSKCLAYSLTTGGWSTVLPYADWASGSALSAATSDDKARVTMNQNGTHHLYTWDGGSPTYTVATSQWTDSPEPARSKVLREYTETITIDNNAIPLYTAIHRNGRKTFAEDAYIASGSNILHTNTDCFTATDVGKYVLIRGAGVGGGALLARIGTYSSSQQVSLVVATGDFAGAGVQNAATTVTTTSPAYMLIAQYIYSRSIPAQYGGHISFEPKRWKVRECGSFAISIYMAGMTQEGQAISCEVKGTVNTQQRGRAQN